MPKPKIVKKQSIPVNLDPGTHYFCTCGHSKDQPFCDGSHPEDFTPKRFKIAEPTRAYLCLCKHSKKNPYCDGSHKHIEDDK